MDTLDDLILNQLPKHNLFLDKLGFNPVLQQWICILARKQGSYIFSRGESPHTAILLGIDMVINPPFPVEPKPIKLTEKIYDKDPEINSIFKALLS